LPFLGEVRLAEATPLDLDVEQTVLLLKGIMFPGFRIGTLFGFPIRVHLSFLVLLGAVLLWMGGLAGVLMVLLVAGSVVVHELGHALVARHLGVPVAGIGLHFFGGAARIVGIPRHPGDEIAIAAAGPAVSFALAGLGHGLAAVTGFQGFALFGWVNLVLAMFNLLPAFPSDGGRILRAWLARRRGLVRATDLAVTVGRVVCVALGVTGLAIGSFQLVIVAVVLWMAGGSERLSARLRGDHGALRGDDDQPSRPLVEYIPRASTRRAPNVLSDRPIVFVWRR
jgi:Zn-dependent protease